MDSSSTMFSGLELVYREHWGDAAWEGLTNRQVKGFVWAYSEDGAGAEDKMDMARRVKSVMGYEAGKACFTFGVCW